MSLIEEIEDFCAKTDLEEFISEQVELFTQKAAMYKERWGIDVEIKRVENEHQVQAELL